MEEILIAIFQFFFTVSLEALLWIPFSLLSLNKGLLMTFGILIGVISLYLYPQHIISIYWLRTLNLLITPFLVAGFIQWLEKKITGIEKIQKKDYTFWDVYIFALSFALVRYLFAD